MCSPNEKTPDQLVCKALPPSVSLMQAHDLEQLEFVAATDEGVQMMCSIEHG